jgi:hypothetical protein
MNLNPRSFLSEKVLAVSPDVRHMVVTKLEPRLRNIMPFMYYHKIHSIYVNDEAKFITDNLHMPKHCNKFGCIDPRCTAFQSTGITPVVTGFTLSPEIQLNMHNAKFDNTKDIEFAQCDNCKILIFGNKLIKAAKDNSKNHLKEDTFYCPFCVIDQVILGKQTGTCNLCLEKGNVAHNKAANLYICKTCTIKTIGKCASNCKSCAAYFIYYDPVRAKTIVLSKERCANCTAKLIREYDYKPNAEFRTYLEIKDVEAILPSPQAASFGIEIEVMPKNNQIARAKFDYAGGLLDMVSDPAFFYLKRDSSIEEGFEIVTHPATLDWWQSKYADKAIFEGLSWLAKYFESFWNAKCGIHVHTGKAQFASKLHIAAFYRFINENKYLASFVAERINGQYSNFSFDVSADAYALVSGGKSSNKGTDNKPRHVAVNLLPPMTVETRIFKGNLKKSRILKDIEFVDAVRVYTKPSHEGTLSAELIAIQKQSLQGFLEFVDGSEEYPNLRAFLKKLKFGSIPMKEAPLLCV